MPRALSKLFLMASRKSVVFTKCSFSFTLGEKGVGKGWGGPGGRAPCLSLPTQRQLAARGERSPRSGTWLPAQPQPPPDQGEP